MPTAPRPLAGPRRARPVSPPPPPTPRAPVTPPPVAPAAPASPPCAHCPRSTTTRPPARLLPTARPVWRRPSRDPAQVAPPALVHARDRVRCGRGGLRPWRHREHPALRPRLGRKRVAFARNGRPLPLRPSHLVDDHGHRVARTIAPKNAPCPMEPGPGDPCAELLAPFTASVPTVNIEDLPGSSRHPWPPWLRSSSSRAVHAQRLPAPREAKAKEPAETESEETQAAPQGINPDAEDSQTAPARVVPTTPPAKPAEPRSSDMSSARAEAT